LNLTGLNAQENSFAAKTDSLRKVINIAEGENKLNALNELSTLLFYNASDDVSLETYLHVSDEYIKEAQMQKQTKLQGDAKVSAIIARVRCGKFDEVEKRALETLNFLKTNGQMESMYVVFKQLILSYCRQGKYDFALAELGKTYNQATAENDLLGQFYAQYLTGIVYMHQDRIDKAEEHYMQSVETAKKINKKPFDLITVYSELCNMMQVKGRFDDFFALMGETETLLKQLEKQNVNRKYTTNWENIFTLYAYAYSFMGEFDRAETYCNSMDSIGVGNPVTSFNSAYIRSQIFDSRKQYDRALELIDKAIELDPNYIYTRFQKVKILSHIENAPCTWAETDATVAFADSVRNADFNAQLDELRTQYEVDKLEMQKAQNHRNFLFALGGVVLLLIIVVIIFINRQKIHRKNKTLVLQIRELQELQQIKENELLQKITFETPETDIKELCPESRKNKICLKLRDLLLKDKIYRDEKLTRETLTSQLGVNRHDLDDAFQLCFGMYYTKYINLLRLKDAVAMLEQSDLSIIEISEKAGFGTLRTFQRQFTAQYNMSPKDYRAAGKELKIRNYEL
jgi:AraC-like DNA-binding protein/Tfp pilus assembly protein PilF